VASLPPGRTAKSTRGRQKIYRVKKRRHAKSTVYEVQMLQRKGVKEDRKVGIEKQNGRQRGAAGEEVA